MSALGNQVHEYLSRTKRKMSLQSLYSMFMVNKPLMAKTLEELVGAKRLEPSSQGGHKLFKALETGNEAAKPAYFAMRPYVPPSSLVERKREIEAQRAEFPSRFD